jgi:hypothetical protein
MSTENSYKLSLGKDEKANKSKYLKDLTNLTNKNLLESFSWV